MEEEEEKRLREREWRVLGLYCVRAVGDKAQSPPVIPGNNTTQRPKDSPVRTWNVISFYFIPFATRIWISSIMQLYQLRPQLIHRGWGVSALYASDPGLSLSFAPSGPVEAKPSFSLPLGSQGMLSGLGLECA